MLIRHGIDAIFESPDVNQYTAEDPTTRTLGECCLNVLCSKGQEYYTTNFHQQK